LAGELIKNFEASIEALTLIPSDGGRYEITVNNQLVFSKLARGWIAESAEVVSLVRKFMQEGTK
jgi:selenoprotein W-related protein